MLLADLDPGLSMCLTQRVHSGVTKRNILATGTGTAPLPDTSPDAASNRGNTTTSIASTAPSYPPCLYTRSQLERVIAQLGRRLKEFGYTVPAACNQVLHGTARGGTDASAVALAQPLEPQSSK